MVSGLPTPGDPVTTGVVHHPPGGALGRPIGPCEGCGRLWVAHPRVWCAPCTEAYVRWEDWCQRLHEPAVYILNP